MTKIDIAKYEERDAVSFYMPLARQMKAEKFKMSLPEYTKKLREFKSGKFEHAIFLSKKWIINYSINYFEVSNSFL